MNDLIAVEKIAQWKKLKAMVLDSVSSPITKRVYNMALEEFLAWFQEAPRPGFTKATVSAWRVSPHIRRVPICKRLAFGSRRIVDGTTGIDKACRRETFGSCSRASARSDRCDLASSVAATAWFHNAGMSRMEIPAEPNRAALRPFATEDDRLGCSTGECAFQGSA